MKYIDTSFVADPVRQPFTAKSLAFLQDSYKEAINALFRAIAGYTIPNVVILYGCEISGSDPGTRSITSGAVYYEGEIYLVDAATFTTTGSNIPVWVLDLLTFDSGIDPVTFSDLSAHSVHQVRKFKLVEGPIGGSGVTGYICDYNGATISSISQASKYANKAQSSWVSMGGLTFANGFLNTNAQYKKDEWGNVYLRGIIHCPSSGGTGNSFTLPVGFRPGLDAAFTLTQNSGSPTFGNRYATMDSATGTLTFQDAAPVVATDIYLNGVVFSI